MVCSRIKDTFSECKEKVITINTEMIITLKDKLADLGGCEVLEPWK